MKNRVRFALCICEGRLGNQVLQYAGIQKLFPRASICSLAFSDIKKLLELEHLFCPKSNLRLTEIFLRRFITPVLLRPLFKFARIGFYFCETSYSAPGSSLRKGLLPIALIERSYFQHLGCQTTLDFFRKVPLKKQFSAATTETPHYKLAIHVRRGDYLNFSSGGTDKVYLEAEYYFKAIEHLRERFVDTSCPAVVSDDIEWCRSAFSDLAGAKFFSFDQFTDFSILLGAENLIISNSTFALSAALLSKQVKSVVAPKYWLGHRVKRWIPEGIEVADNRFIYL